MLLGALGLTACGPSDSDARPTDADLNETRALDDAEEMVEIDRPGLSTTRESRD